MSDRPDPMQTFYLRQGRTSQPAEFPQDDDDSIEPVTSVTIRIRWSGLLWLTGFVLLLGGVSRLFGVRVAEVVAVAVLLGLALTVVLARIGRKLPFVDGIPWVGDVGSEQHVHVHVDHIGYFDGGGGGHH